MRKYCLDRVDLLEAARAAGVRARLGRDQGGTRAGLGLAGTVRLAPFHAVRVSVRNYCLDRLDLLEAARAAG